MKVEYVKNKKELREFIELPKEIYQSDGNWVPPIWNGEKNNYNAKNPVLAEGDFVLILVRKDGDVIARNLVYIDPAFNRYYKCKTGFFGAFECVNDPDAARLLMAETEKWIAERGMDSVRGPIHPTAEIWGFLYDGFGEPPIFMSPHNPAYYNDFMTDTGFSKAKDLLVYNGDIEDGYEMPERFFRFKRNLLKRNPKFTVRKMSKKNLLKDAEKVWEISNEGYAHNWGYVPVGRDIFLSVFNQIKPVFDPDTSWFVEDEGKPVSYCLGFPDLNKIIKKIDGQLFPFGFISILRGVKKINHFRLFGLAVLPEYQGLGLDVLLYVSLFESVGKKGGSLEANYILEDNFYIKNALEKMNLQLTKTYRVYEKKLNLPLIF